SSAGVTAGALCRIRGGTPSVEAEGPVAGIGRLAIPRRCIMGVADGIIPKLKDIQWEEKGRPEIETERAAIAVAKVVPLVEPILKKFLRDQLVGSGGHAKDELAKRMFNHYLDAFGLVFVLTLDDMKHMNSPAVPGHDGIDVRMKDMATRN